MRVLKLTNLSGTLDASGSIALGTLGEGDRPVTYTTGIVSGTTSTDNTVVTARVNVSSTGAITLVKGNPSQTFHYVSGEVVFFVS